MHSKSDEHWQPVHPVGAAAPQVRRKALERLLMAADSMAGILVQQARNKKLGAADRRQAAIAVLDRAGLKPTDKLEISGPDGEAITAEIDVAALTDFQLAIVKLAQLALKSKDWRPSAEDLGMLSV